MTLEQAANFLKLPPAELRSLVVQNLIGYTQQGERLFFSQDDLDEWLSRGVIALQTMKPAAQRKARKTLRISDTSKPFLETLCTPNTCACAIEAKSRPSVLKALTALAEGSELLYAPEDLYDELLEREEIASTAIEQGAALPHPHHRFETPLFEGSFLCVATLKTPIFFGTSPDGKKTDILFLTCCLDSNLHIQTIARICQLCMETSLLEELRQARDADDIHNILIDTDRHPEAHPLKRLQIADEE